MSDSNFGDSMGWSNSGRSSGSKKGKRGGGSGSGADKPKQPQRGLGVAQLEKIRLQSEMAEYFHPLGQAPSLLIHRTGCLSLVSDVLFNLLHTAHRYASSLCSLHDLAFLISCAFPNGLTKQEDARAPTSTLSSSPSSSLHATAISLPFPIHPNFTVLGPPPSEVI
jgi:hypothetical protein